MRQIVKCTGQRNPKNSLLLTKTENRRLNWRKSINPPRKLKNRTKHGQILKPKIPTPPSWRSYSLVTKTACKVLKTMAQKTWLENVFKLITIKAQINRVLVWEQFPALRIGASFPACYMTFSRLAHGRCFPAQKRQIVTDPCRVLRSSLRWRNCTKKGCSFGFILSL